MLRRREANLWSAGCVCQTVAVSFPLCATMQTSEGQPWETFSYPAFHLLWIPREIFSHKKIWLYYNRIIKTVMCKIDFDNGEGRDSCFLRPQSWRATQSLCPSAVFVCGGTGAKHGLVTEEKGSGGGWVGRRGDGGLTIPERCKWPRNSWSPVVSLTQALAACSRRIYPLVGEKCRLDSPRRQLWFLSLGFG